MKKLVFAAAAAGVAIALPAGAQAQDIVPGSGFVGVQAGIHDLGIAEEVQAAVVGLEVDDSSPIYGVFAGYDFPIGPTMFLGVEGNYNFGSEALDGDYGASVRLGLNVPGGTKIYARGGYQAVKVDYNALVDDDTIDFSAFDDTEADFLAGLGVEVPVAGVFLRGNIDTISFDTMRATAGVGLRF